MRAAQLHHKTIRPTSRTRLQELVCFIEMHVSISDKKTLKIQCIPSAAQLPLHFIQIQGTTLMPEVLSSKWLHLRNPSVLLPNIPGQRVVLPFLKTGNRPATKDMQSVISIHELPQTLLSTEICRALKLRQIFDLALLSLSVIG